MAKKKRKPKGEFKVGIKRPGAFTRWCKARGFGGVTLKCIQAGAKAKSGIVRRQANLARMFKYKWNTPAKRARKRGQKAKVSK